MSTSVTGIHHPEGPSILPSCMLLSVVSSLVNTGPDSSESSAIYSNLSNFDLLVMDLIGTNAAAVPAAKTSEKEGSSSYLICSGSLVEHLVRHKTKLFYSQSAFPLCSQGSCQSQDSYLKLRWQ